MPLISCLRKLGSFDSKQQQYLLNKSKELQEKGMSALEADLKVINDLKAEALTDIKNIYKQLDIPLTKDVVSTTIGSSGSLKPMRIAYKKDTEILEQEEYNKLPKAEREGYKEIVRPAQVLISWNVRNPNGTLYNMKDFLRKGEDGIDYIDTTKLPKELLTQFGFRIPNQGHNSMSLIEVVGFLPESYVGIVVASRNFITQMGSDFDVDKLYIYNYFTEEKEGRLRKTDDVQNKLTDIHKSVMYNPAIFNGVVRPLDVGEIKDIVSKIKKSDKTVRENYLSPDYDRTKYMESLDGKTMVGRTSIGNVFSTLIQNSGIFLQKAVEEDKSIPDYIVWKDRNGKIHQLSALDSPYTYTGRKKNEVHQGLQSAAVDNEKDPLLSYINANLQTSGVINLLINLGLEEEEIYLFTALPVIKEYVKRVRVANNGFSREFKTNRAILNDLIQQYKSIEETLLVKLNVDNLQDYPLGPEEFNFVLFDEGKSILSKEEIETIALHKFVKLLNYGEDLEKIQNSVNIESKGIKSILDLSNKRKAIEGALTSSKFANIQRIAGELNEGVLESETVTGYAIENSIFAADDVIKNQKLMPYSFDAFNRIVETYKALVDPNRDITPEQQYEIWKGVKAYLISGNFDPKERQRIFFDTKTNKSLNTRINEAKKLKLKNNQFIQRLDLSTVDKTGLTPSLVFYNSAKEEDIEELNIYQSFLDLFYNEDQEIRDIGRDLVKYFFINGGNPQARDWARYIDAQMVKDIGVADYVRSLDISNAETYNGALLQFFQHNPYFIQPSPTEGVLFSKDRVRIKRENAPRLNSAPSPIIKLKADLYKYIGLKDGDPIYEKVPRLGGKFFNEYQKELTIADTVPAKIVETEYEKETYPNIIAEKEYSDLIDVSLSTALGRMSTSKYHRELAKLFLQLESIIGAVKVEGNSVDTGYFGRWNNKNISIGLQELRNRGRLDRKTIESTILKETIHVLNTKLFRSEFKPTPAQLEARTAITNIFESIVEGVRKGEYESTWNSAIFTRFEQLRAKKQNREQLSKEEEEFLIVHKPTYYGLTNVEDFLHEALLQDEFRQVLNGIQYDSEKSFLQRIQDLIAQILDGFRELVGINKNSVLDEAFANLIRLTDTTITKQKIKAQVKAESTGITYNKEQQEALDAVFAYINDKNSTMPFYVIEGKAGTGKTTIAQEIALKYPNKTITLAALSHKAKNVIVDKFDQVDIKNYKDYSLAGLLGLKLDQETGMFTKDYNSKNDPPITGVQILIVDEASMVNEEALSIIQKEKPRNAKIIFLGDIGQLPPIRSARNPYYANNLGALSKKSPVFDSSDKSKLLERVRQGEDSPILPFADNFWENSQKANPLANPAEDRKTTITDKGALIFTNSIESIYDKVSDSFREAVTKRNPNHIKIVTYRNDRKNTLNAKIHNTLFPNGAEFELGELILFNESFGDIENSTETQIKEVSLAKTSQDGIKYVTVKAVVDKKLQEFPVVLRESKGLFNKLVSDKFAAAFALKSGSKFQYFKALEEAWAFKNSFANVDYGYAITSHKSQGSTYDMVIVDEQDINSVQPIGNKEKSESIYTALTRARNIAVVISSVSVPDANIDTLENINNNIKASKDISNDEAFDLPSGEEPKLYKSLLNDFDTRLNYIARDISKARLDKNKELVTILENRYEEVKGEKETLITENNLDSIINVANKELAEIDRLLKNPELTENNLGYIRTVLGTWTKITSPEIYDILTGFDRESRSHKYNLLADVRDAAQRYQDQLNEIQLNIIQKWAEKDLGRKITREDLTKIKDITSAQAAFRDITTSDNAMLDLLAKVIRKQDLATITELNEMIATLEKVQEGIIKEGVVTREDMSRVFGQENEKGELTGELVDALTSKYYSTRDGLLAKAQNESNKEARKEAWKDYYSWIADNHIIVEPLGLYKETNNGTFEYSPRQAYLDAIKEQLGEDYDKTINRAKELIEQYNEDLLAQIKYYEGNPDGATQLEIWKATNSPLVYLDNLKNGYTYRKIGDTDIHNVGWKYIARRAKSEWEDAKYNAIQSNAALKAYYDFYRNSLNNLYHYLPYNIRKDLKPTEIPNIEKTYVQELHDSGINKWVNRTWSALLTEISVGKNEPTPLKDPVTGEFAKEFRFAYLDKLNPNHKSYDLSSTLKLFAAQAIGYKHKSKVEDQVRLIESVMKEALEKQMSATGLPKVDKFGRSTTTKGLKNLYNQLDYAIDSWYGNKKDSREGEFGKGFITPADREKMNAEIADLDKYNYPEHIRLAKVRGITDKYTRKYTLSKLGDTLLQYMQLKGMGWNVFGGVNNALFGQMANYNWAAAGTDFSDEDITKAVGIMLSTNADTKKKVEALMTKFNTVKQLRDKVYSATTNYNKARKGLSKLLPYELYAQGEYFVQGQVMVAMLNAQKVKVGDTEIPIFEALDNEGNWNTEKFGENKEWETLGNASLDFKLKLDTVLKKIHGNYDPNASLLISKKFLGRALVQFRRWIPEGVAQRFDSEKYDAFLQRTTKGRYRTYADLGWKKSVETLLRMVWFRSSDKAFENLDQTEQLDLIKENMRKNLREIYFKLSLMGVFLTLSGLEDDDDDYWTRAAKNYSMNTILRLQDDIEFYYSPIAFDNITRTALPVSNIIVDFAKFSDAFVDTMSGEGVYKNGVHSGDTKLFWRGMKLLPFGSAVVGLTNKLEGQESFRK